MKKITSDLDRLQGEWTIASIEIEGNAMSSPPDARIVIKGHKFKSTGMGANEYNGRLELDESKKPRRLDMHFTTGPQKGIVNPCIYEFNGEFKGDELKLCIAMQGTTRPKKFASSPGTGFAFEILTRGKPASAKKAKATKPAAAAPPPSGPATEIDGEWSMVSAVMNGVPMDPSMVSWVRRSTHGNRTKVTAGPQTMMEATFTLHSSTSPKGIDYVNTAGSNKGKSQLGIYEFTGGILSIFIAPPGKLRPQNIPAKPADGTLTVWKRA